MSEDAAKLLIEQDYQVILEKLSKDKETKQKGLEELRRRKKELAKQPLFDSDPLPPTSKPRQTLSSERRHINDKVYEHLLSPKPKEIRSPKVQCHSRFEEEELKKKMSALNAQRNRLRLIDKKARYAGFVREIFVPNVDQAKRSEVEGRINYGSTKTRSAYNSRGNSPERNRDEEIQPSYSSAQLGVEKRKIDVIKIAAKTSLESPRNRII
jgi:hypothetical protein